jgi:hypothetical protein
MITAVAKSRTGSSALNAHSNCFRFSLFFISPYFIRRHWIHAPCEFEHHPTKAPVGHLYTQPVGRVAMNNQDFVPADLQNYRRCFLDHKYFRRPFHDRIPLRHFAVTNIIVNIVGDSADKQCHGADGKADYNGSQWCPHLDETGWFFHIESAAVNIVSKFSR